MIQELSERQEDVKELLASVRKIEDKSPREELASNLGYDDAVVTAAVLAAREMKREPDGPIDENDLVWAGAYLDHLDTQGFEIRRKKEKKHGKRKQR